jgi:hypothetical protein
MRKRTVKLWRLHDDGRKLYAGTIEAAVAAHVVERLFEMATSPPWLNRSQ